MEKLPPTIGLTIMRPTTREAMDTKTLALPPPALALPSPRTPGWIMQSGVIREGLCADPQARTDYSGTDPLTELSHSMM